MASIVFHQSYMTKYLSLFTLTSYQAIVLSFALFIDGWFTCCALAFCITSAY